jgi:L,D-peptidoglycan transpeptidase YkuD (ErfK/YbiS/YcfS/YnhG family)
VHRSCGRAAAILLAMVVLAGCGTSSTPRAQGEPSTTSTLADSTAAPTTVAPAAPTTTAGPAPADPVLTQVGTAGQAVVVNAERYGATTATLTAYERDGAGGWRRAFGPWPARVGSRGLAPPGEKREGDGRTPSGVYGFDFFFGVAPDPGTRFPYRRVTSRSIVWDDDPASPLYNTWVDLDRQQAGAEPELMYVSPAYDHGAVIAYNTARTPGLGSAIFLHVSTGGATAGCVSLPAGQLVEVLRWLDPARGPRIVLGVAG